MYYTFKQAKATHTTPATSISTLLARPELIWETPEEALQVEPEVKILTVLVPDEKLEALKTKNSSSLEKIKRTIQTILETNPDIDYDHFKIPKRSGGLRQIDAPKPPLMTALRILKRDLETYLSPLTHDAAYAYVKERTAKAAVEAHQKNESKWFLKLDIKDFFPSCTEEIVEKQLQQVYPFNMLYSYFGEAFTNVLHYCFLDNKLPQGTPMSPMLSNFVMTPVDYQIEQYLKGKNQFFIYTRYADDILISSKYTFDWKTMQTDLNNIIKAACPTMQLKTEKTRYGAAHGRNWNLGLMLNKDNNITIGYRKKERFRAMMYNFLTENPWSVEDTQHLVGLVSYYRSIEPDYVKNTIEKIEQKTGRDFKTTIKSILNPNRS